MDIVTSTKAEFIPIKRVLWCSLNNHAVRADMPAVYIEGKELKRESHLRYLGITYDYLYVCAGVSILLVSLVRSEGLLH